MTPRPFIGAALVGAALFVCASAPVAGATTIERVGPRLAHPWGMDFIGTDQVLVTVRGGGLRAMDDLRIYDSALSPKAIYDCLSVKLWDEESERMVSFAEAKEILARSKEKTTA